MDCTEFLESYSDYRDGTVTDPGKLRRIRFHLANCGACARYDSSFREGVGQLWDIEPSEDFRDRLRKRIAATAGDPMEPTRRGAGSIAAALMIAAAVALVIYSRRSEPGPMIAVPVTQSTPADSLRATTRGRTVPLVVVNPGMPFVTFIDLSTGSGSLQNVSAPPAGREFQVQTDIPVGDWANLPR